MGFFRDIAEEVGKWIPNEFSKMNSVTKFIPGVGQVFQGISAVDNFATAYGDDASFGTALQGAMKGLGGFSANPSGGGFGRTPGNIFDYVGQIGNMIPGGGGNFSDTVRRGIPWLTQQLGNQQPQQPPIPQGGGRPAYYNQPPNGPRIIDFRNYKQPGAINNYNYQDYLSTQNRGQYPTSLTY